VPGGTVGDQRIPSRRAPAFGDTVALEDEVRHAALSEMFAYRDPGLPAADHEGLDFFD